MVVRDFYKKRNDGVRLYKTYSNSGYFIKQNSTNIVYSEAIDVENTTYTYEETDELIPIEEATKEEKEAFKKAQEFQEDVI